jgi:3-oxoacyl-[acyl-carrier-protein] synthase II
MTFSANGNEHKRVVVTGLGAITPLGLSPEEFWRHCLAGKSGAANVTLFDTSKLKTKFAAEVKGFEPAHYVESKEVKRLGRSTLFSLAAARQALEDAGLKGFPSHFEPAL